MHPIKTLFLICVIVITSSSTTAGLAAETKQVAPSVVRADDQHLSIQAANIPLDILLAEIARQSHIDIFIQGPLDGTVTIALHRASLASGIKRLINGHNHAFTYGYNNRNEVVIQQLHIYSTSGTGDTKRLTPAANDQPAKTAEDDVNNGIAIHPETPKERSPLVSMQAIDPLMKINKAQAPHLPEGFHDDVVNDRILHRTFSR